MADFIHFRFGNYHSKDLNLIVTSSSNFYSQDLLPSNTDTTTDISGSNGKYYFGSIFSTREFTLNLAFDSITEDNLRLISQIFGNDKPQDLVFDERPYKTYKAKIKSKPTFKYVCFLNQDGERVYKGTGTLNMVCYSPFAYCFNKYIVRSADYYIHTPPEKAIKEWYNTEINIQPWYGGYPTYDQVKKGELYFNTPSGTRSIIDVRRYWDNIPEWARSSRLLTTPTLDYDQELMYAPQCSKVGYLNLDKGFDKTIDTNLLTNRLFVYNPGDLPIDFELNFNNPGLSTFFQKHKDANGHKRFRIRRLNVQRLGLADAVNWCGLTTQDLNDNVTYKYDNKYFKRVGDIDGSSIDRLVSNNEIKSLSVDDLQDTVAEMLSGHESFDDLGPCHPKHCYMIEPIPREKLGDYIRTFCYQTAKSNTGFTNQLNELSAAADRYEELYDLCITEQEKFQLYWETLINTVLKFYGNTSFFKSSTQQSMYTNYTIDSFINDYLFDPPEYLVDSEDAAYGQFIFNYNNLPQYYTGDYLEIDITDLSIDEGGNASDLPEQLILDTENRMLYNIIEDNTNTYYGTKSKNILNDYITKGHWFQLPPGWSVIEIIPVLDQDITDDKTWKAAREYYWGYNNNSTEYDADLMRAYYNCVYDLAKDNFLTYAKWNLGLTSKNYSNQELIRHWLVGWKKYIEDNEDNEDNKNFVESLYTQKLHSLEVQFLKTIQSYW
jgi:hypothetical protein